MDCPICQHPTVVAHRTGVRRQPDVRVLRCASCSVEFLDPALWAATNYRDGSYRTVYSPVPGQGMAPREVFEFYRPLQTQRLERLSPLLDPSFVVLDIGCSAGHLLAQLIPRVRRAVGLELNADEAAFARRELDIIVSERPVEDTDLPRGTFDLITATDVIEHVPDPVAFVQATLQLLRPGGRLYLETPNRNDALLDMWQVEPYAAFWYRLPHLYYFTSDALATAIHRAGGYCEITSAQTYGLMNHLHWLIAGTPQASLTLGTRHLGDYLPPTTVSRHDQVREALDAADTAYRASLVHSGSGDTLVATVTRR